MMLSLSIWMKNSLGPVFDSLGGEGFILRTASRHAGHTVTRSDDRLMVVLGERP